MPQVTIIVPVYQAESFLSRCVESIQSQSLQDWELLLIDDGSRDGSWGLCQRYAAKDKRIRCVHKENGGVSSARNLGLTLATGDYITFVDSDDWIAPAMLGDLYGRVMATQADSAGCGLTYITPQGDCTTEAGVLPAGVYDSAQIRSQLLAPLAGHRVGAGVINGYSVRFLFSREVIQTHQITFEGAYLEDELFLLEYFYRAQKLVMVDNPYYYYLQNPASVTRRYLPTYLEVFARFLERKTALMAEFDLESLVPLWRESTCFAGLLIAIGNEYAPGNTASFWQKRCHVKALCRQGDMVRALQAIRPQGQSRNKEIVVKLVRLRQYSLLTALYYVKNRRG